MAFKGYCDYGSMIKKFKCPICGWSCGNQSQMSVHIKIGHTEDEVNEAVDDGRIVENPAFFFTPSDNTK